MLAQHQRPVSATQARWEVWLLRILAVVGVLTLVSYFDWCRNQGGSGSLWLVSALGLVALYNWAQMLGNWFLYIMARHRPPAPRPSPDLTVDVFVTAYKEPVTLIERSLRASCAMRGNHRTWLLDDGDDPALATLARRLGAGYLTRSDHAHMKAGNVNAALRRTEGDIVVIFDADHAPMPDFLERSLGYFEKPEIGFVQVMLTFGNGDESWVAKAATQSSVDFYNLAASGMDGLGSVTLVGSNALIRRSALTSIGGYRPGLAEDLATSIAIHAAGWQSVYVQEPLAPGLAPPDLPAWFTQQLKWARGVFEVLLTDYPRFFPRLTWGQRLSYLVRMTYYWIGPVVCAQLILTSTLLLGGSHAVRLDFRQYALHLFPVVAFAVLLRQLAMYIWRHPSVPLVLPWRAVMLVFPTWPIYTLALIMALLRLPLAFRLTPKTRTGSTNSLWILPQVVMVTILSGAVLHLVFIGDELTSPFLIFTALIEVALQAFLILHWLRTQSRGAEPVQQLST